MPSILIVLTGARTWTQRDGRQRPTGFWAEELVEPHRALRQAGVDLTIATPGARVPVPDAGSLRPDTPGNDAEKVADWKAYLAEIDGELANPLRLEDVDPADYDGVLIPGGHGPMQDLAVDPDVARILGALLPDPAKVVASLCHGPASFLGAGDADGWLFRGREMTAFSDDEETQAGLAAQAPWLLETRLRDAGATLVTGPAWQSFTVADGNLLTGQNPASGKAVAELILARLAATSPVG